MKGAVMLSTSTPLTQHLNVNLSFPMVKRGFGTHPEASSAPRKPQLALQRCWPGWGSTAAPAPPAQPPVISSSPRCPEGGGMHHRWLLMTAGGRGKPGDKCIFTPGANTAKPNFVHDQDCAVLQK